MKELALKKMEKLKDLLRYHINDGIKMKYRISIDHLEVVPCNSDLEKFDRYKEFILQDSFEIRVSMYLGEREERSEQRYYLRSLLSLL